MIYLKYLGNAQNLSIVIEEGSINGLLGENKKNYLTQFIKESRCYESQVRVFNRFYSES